MSDYSCLMKIDKINTSSNKRLKQKVKFIRI